MQSTREPVLEGKVEDARTSREEMVEITGRILSHNSFAGDSHVIAQPPLNLPHSLLNDLPLRAFVFMHNTLGAYSLGCNS